MIFIAHADKAAKTERGRNYTIELYEWENQQVMISM